MAGNLVAKGDIYTLELGDVHTWLFCFDMFGPSIFSNRSRHGFRASDLGLLVGLELDEVKQLFALAARQLCPVTPLYLVKRSRDETRKGFTRQSDDL